MKIEQQLRLKIKQQHKSRSTANVYWQWCRRFLVFVKEKQGEWVHPDKLREPDVEAFLSHLANKEFVSSNTQNQAFSAICYLYRHVLNQPLENMSAARAKRPDRIRDVLDQSEIAALFKELSGVNLFVARMMYASGFRIGELGLIRIKDISFERCQIVVRMGKGKKDRVVGFPKSMHESTRHYINKSKEWFEFDKKEGLAGVSLPDAYGRKSPSAHMDFAWWYLLPSENYSRDPESGSWLRHHRDMGHIARQIKLAAKKAGIHKRITSHCLRHSFATHSLESGVAIHFVQQLLGHANVETTQRYLHSSTKSATAAMSPIDGIFHS